MIFSLLCTRINKGHQIFKNLLNYICFNGLLTGCVVQSFWWSPPPNFFLPKHVVHSFCRKNNIRKPLSYQ